MKIFIKSKSRNVKRSYSLRKEPLELPECYLTFLLKRIELLKIWGSYSNKKTKIIYIPIITDDMKKFSFRFN